MPTSRSPVSRSSAPMPAIPSTMRTLVRDLHALDPDAAPARRDRSRGRARPPPRRRRSPISRRRRSSRATASPPVRAVATAMARELAAIEIDLTFAPVLDVASNAANPVIGDRAFGTTPDTAARGRPRGVSRDPRRRPSHLRQTLSRPRRHRDRLASRAPGRRPRSALARARPSSHRFGARSPRASRC